MATDPISMVNSVFERLFGITSEIRVHVKPPAAAMSADRSGRTGERAWEIEVSVPWK
jgi:hypothetical protein